MVVQEVIGKAKEFLSARKGLSLQEGPIVASLLVLTAITAVFGVYFMITLGTALGNTALTVIINNATAFFTNFFAQFGTLGTIAGISLMLGFIGVLGIGGAMYLNTQVGGKKKSKSSRK